MNFDFNLKQSGCGAKNLALLQKPMHRKSKKWLHFINKRGYSYVFSNVSSFLYNDFF
jgi:hypothetical protein